MQSHCELVTFSEGGSETFALQVKTARFLLESLLIGKKAPAALIQKVRRVIRNVWPEVLSARLMEALDSDARDNLTRTVLPLMYLEATHDKLLPAGCGDEVLRIRPRTYFRPPFTFAT